MAGLRSSIQLIDGASAVLDRITGKNDKMMRSIDGAQNAMNRRTKYTENLSTAEQKLELLAAQYNRQIRTVQNLTKEYQKAITEKGRYAESTQKIEGKLMSAQMKELRFAEAVERAGRALHDQEDGMRSNIRSSDNLTNKLTRLVGAYLSMQGLKKGIQATIGAAAELTEQSAIMQAAFGDADIGKAYFHKLQAYSIKSRQSMEDLTDVTRNFMQLTKNTNKLAGLTEIANKLSRRTNSLGSAENLMQEAMSGRYTRLQRTLHLTDSQMEPLKKAVQKGSLDGIINAFGDALNTAGLTDEIVQAFEDSPLQRLGRITDTIKLKLAATGQTALELLGPVMERIEGWLQSESATQFFAKIANGIAWVTESAVLLFSFISDNWSLIAPIIWGTVAAITAYQIATKGVALATGIFTALKMAAIPIYALLTGATMAETAAQWGLNSAMYACPITWIIIAIIALIAIFYAAVAAVNKFAGTSVSATGIIAGAFMAVLAFIGNLFIGAYNLIIDVVASIWNYIASFAEFFANVFNDPVGSILRLFAGMADSILGVLQGIAKLIDAVFGSNLGDAVRGWRSSLDTAVKDLVGEAKIKIPRMDSSKLYLDRFEYGKAYKAGYGAGESLPNKFSGANSTEDIISKFAAQEAAWNAKQFDTLGSIDDSGKKIKDSVDKSDEDLKWLRDVAEQEVINRFTTANLAPQLSIAFGDVRETADVDGIVARLRDILNEQLVVAAEGVHA